MKPTVKEELWHFFREWVILVALVILALTCVWSVARGDDCYPQRQNVVVKKFLAPQNYGYHNALVQQKVAYSQVYPLYQIYQAGVPAPLYSPIVYQPSPPGEGLRMPQVARTIVTEYEYPDEPPAEPLKEAVEECPTCPPQQNLQGHKQACTPEPLTEPGSLAEDMAAKIAKRSCVSCHSPNAKAEGRPVFFDDAGKLTANAAQRHKMVQAARLGVMPPKPAEPIDDAEFLILADWLQSQAKGSE